MTTHDFHEYDVALLETERKSRTENNFLGKSSSAREFELSASSPLGAEQMKVIVKPCRQAGLAAFGCFAICSFRMEGHQAPFSSPSCLVIVVANSFYLVHNSATACGGVYWFLMQSRIMNH